MRIVITGSSSGIGRALAQRLLAQGHEVWGFARSAQDDCAARNPDRFHPVRCDVSQWSQVAAAVNQVIAAAPELDALVTCAAIHGAVGRAGAVDPLAWSATVRANLDGTFFAIRALWSALLQAPRRAKVVCFSGGGATKARPAFSAYACAKTAVVRLVETIAAEEPDAPVDINALAPGAIATRLTDEIARLGPNRVGTDEYRAAQAAVDSGAAPLQRALDCVEWLLSPASDGIRGRLISAPWDPWPNLDERREQLGDDIYTLRRITPQDRGQDWGQP
jgi:3-oxoacyl-[acyl-carrier protein] reductase